jgi:hypothetical protein
MDTRVADVVQTITGDPLEKSMVSLHIERTAPAL